MAEWLWQITTLHRPLQGWISHGIPEAAATKWHSSTAVAMTFSTQQSRDWICPEGHRMHQALFIVLFHLDRRGLHIQWCWHAHEFRQVREVENAREAPEVRVPWLVDPQRARSECTMVSTSHPQKAKHLEPYGYNVLQYVYIYIMLSYVLIHPTNQKCSNDWVSSPCCWLYHVYIYNIYISPISRMANPPCCMATKQPSYWYQYLIASKRKPRLNHQVPLRMRVQSLESGGDILGVAAEMWIDRAPQWFFQWGTWW